MTIDTIKTIVLITVGVIVIGIGIYLYFRNKSLDDIRADVYQLFLEAEHDPRYTTLPKERMVWVLQQVRGLLPLWLQYMITDAFLEKVVQGWFDAIKDLLDDGKLNKSTDGGEETENE